MNRKKGTLLIAAGLLVATAVVAAMVPNDGASVGEETKTLHGNGSGPLSLSATLDRSAVLQGKDGTVRMELTIQPGAEDASVAVRRPTDLVIVLDRSGSMQGQKMQFAKASIRELLSQLGSDDRFALVSYSSQARIDRQLGPIDDRADLERVLDGISTGGGTNMSSGIDQALAMIERERSSQRVPRAILVSDGLANEGDPSPQGLTRRASRIARDEYALSTIGVGADFNEYLMIALANAGSGNYYYLEDTERLGYVLARELNHAGTTVASGLEIRIDPASGVRVEEVAGYPLERIGERTIVRAGAVFAGQERRLWVTFAVPNDQPGDIDIGKLALAYSSAGDRHTLTLDEALRIACVADEERFLASFDVETWGRSVLTDGYGKMREEVAREVKAGRRDAAMERLNDFRDRVEERATRFSYAPAQEKLKDVDALGAQVQSVFEGEDQAKRQNELSKTESDTANRLRALGYEGY